MLRQQIETERARVEQLVRMQGNWPKMLEVVARVRAAHALAGEDPVVTVEALSAELLRVKQAHAELLERFELQTMQQQRERLMAVPDEPHERNAPDDETLPASFRGFIGRVKQYAARVASKANRSYDRLLDEVEARLDQLDQAPRRERYEHAVALAYLAWRLACSSEKKVSNEEL
jgi:hypothetical protein